MNKTYPETEVIGKFPAAHLELLKKIVRERKAKLARLRNKKDVRSTTIGKILWPDLEKAGYEKKRWYASEDCWFAMDGINERLKVGIEVEKGRVILGNQIYLDFYKFLLNPKIDYGVLIVPSSSREKTEKPFDKTVEKISPIKTKIEGHQRLLSQIPLKGILIIGY